MAAEVKVSYRKVPRKGKTSIKKVPTKVLQEALAEAREQDTWRVMIRDIATDRGEIRKELDARLVDPIEGAALLWDSWARDEAAGLEWD